MFSLPRYVDQKLLKELSRRGAHCPILVMRFLAAHILMNSNRPSASLQ
jgi:hypothetical protein